MRAIDEMPQIWSPEVAQAIAQHMSMPGLEDRQQQFVRYAGQMEAKKVEDGWLMGESEAAYKRVHGAQSGPGFNPKNCLPQQVQLTVTSAPAEFCLPMKNDRQFKPHFQVQVRVVHNGSLLLPLRLKAFAIIQDDKNQIVEWLPDELREATVERRARMAVDLKGSTVVSYVFQSTTTTTGQPTISQIPQMPSASGRMNATAESTPCFPSRVVRPADARNLQHSDSIRSQDNDPDIATPLNLGSVCNTVVAQYEFKYLEFARPTRMNPVYMVFACLVADQDLLFCLYDVPCISICRAEQRPKALERLGLPNTVYREIEERGGGHVVAPLPTTTTTTTTNAADTADAAAANAEDPDRRGMDTIWTAIARQNTQANRLQPQDQGTNNTNQNGHVAAAAHVADGSELPTDFSLPLTTSGAPQSFLGRPLNSLTPEDVQHDRILQDNLVKESNAVLGTGGSSMRELMSNTSLNQFIMDLAKDPSNTHNFTFNPTDPAALAGVGPDFSGLSQGLPADAMRSKRGFPLDDAGANAAAASVAAAAAGAGAMHDINSDAPPQLDQLSMDPAALLAGRNLRPATDASRAGLNQLDDLSAAAVASAGTSFAGQWLNQAHNAGLTTGGATLGSLDDAAGVTQLDAYNWTIEEYASTGLQRQLTRQDYQALLSMAGFPVLAGLDVHARVATQQFVEFQRQFRAALSMLRSISGLWNRQDPCIVSGFDMDRRRAISALASQPVGTFICRFSMNQPGCLVLSCKVKPETHGAEEGDLLHLTISMADLQHRRIEQVIMSLPYASHVLDVYTNRRVDKRTQLSSSYIRVNCVHDATPADTTSADVRAASSVSRSVN